MLMLIGGKINPDKVCLCLCLLGAKSNQDKVADSGGQGADSGGQGADSGGQGVKSCPETPVLSGVFSPVPYHTLLLVDLASKPYSSVRMLNFYII